MPSGALGFFGRMYRSRCRPSELDVKACPQKGQFLSFGAFSSGGSAVDRGVPISVSPMLPGSNALRVPKLRCELVRPF